jgi:hypothetical protein
MGSDDVADAIFFDEQGGVADHVWGYYPARKEGAQTHSECGPGENAVRIKPERRLISAAFQVSKIDNSRRKKCSVAVLPGIYLPIGVSVQGPFSRNFGKAWENASGDKWNEWIGGDKT